MSKSSPLEFHFSCLHSLTHSLTRTFLFVAKFSRKTSHLNQDNLDFAAEYILRNPKLEMEIQIRMRIQSESGIASIKKSQK